MAKKGKIHPFQLASAYGVLQAVNGNARRIGAYLQRRFQREPAAHDHDDDHNDDEARARQFNSRIRLLFVVAAFPVVVVSLMLMMFALMEGEGEPHQSAAPGSAADKFKRIVQDYSSFVLFISACSAAINTVAICGAVFNWPTVLFAYVVITGIVGTVVGVVGIVGIIITCLLMSHKSKSDHSIGITALVVLLLVLIFYVLTIIALKLMSIARRRSTAAYDAEARRARIYKGSPVSRRVKRSSYKSIDTITSPFVSNENEEQELNQVYVDKSQINSPSSVKLSHPEANPPYRTSFSFQV